MTGEKGPRNLHKSVLRNQISKNSFKWKRSLRQTYHSPYPAQILGHNFLQIWLILWERQFAKQNCPMAPEIVGVLRWCSIIHAWWRSSLVDKPGPELLATFWRQRNRWRGCMRRVPQALHQRSWVAPELGMSVSMANCPATLGLELVQSGTG